MMGITWTPEFSVGVEEIDGQHKERYRNVEIFFEQIRKGNGNGDLADLLTFLEGYQATHFSSEERT